MDGGFCCQVPPDPALPCEAEGTWNCRSPHWLGSESNLTTVVVGSYEFGPSRRYHAGRKSSSFSGCRSWIAPVGRPRGRSGNWWRRRALPPGPTRLLHEPFIAIAGRNRHPQDRRVPIGGQRLSPILPPDAVPERPRLPSGCQSRNLIERDVRITRDEDQSLDPCLGNQHPIERISMMQGKFPSFFGVPERDCQRLETFTQ